MKRLILILMMVVAAVMISHAGLHAYDDIGLLNCEYDGEPSVAVSAVESGPRDSLEGRPEGKRRLMIPDWAMARD